MTTGRQSAFCVVEGLDGTGTTTIAGMLAEALQARDLRVRTTAEPTKGPFGLLLRRHLAHDTDLGPYAAALVFTADRSEHLDTTIRPALRRGEWVISDRYLLSTLAYQGAEGVSQRAILAASAGFEIPDHTFLLDAPDEVRQARMAPRGQVDRYEDPAIAQRLRESYDAATTLLRSNGHRIDVIDATATPETIVSSLVSRLGQLGPVGR
jgi:dTMP kinase